jgi:uncharacterized phage protein (TIGR01671 family)
MRDYKFRGKRVDNGEFVHGDLRQDKDLGTTYINGWNYWSDNIAGLQRDTFEHEVIPESVGQFTGLHDIEKSEIFDGDIIDGSYTNPMSGGLVKRCYLVVFENGCFIAKQIGKSPYGDTLLYFVNHKCKVIGNKFDNPSLLEAQP